MLKSWWGPRGSLVGSWLLRAGLWKRERLAYGEFRESRVKLELSGQTWDVWGTIRGCLLSATGHRGGRPGTWGGFGAWRHVCSLWPGVQAGHPHEPTHKSRLLTYVLRRIHQPIRYKTCQYFMCFRERNGCQFNSATRSGVKRASVSVTV